MSKAPLAKETVGRNPTDRGKKREQASYTGGRAWCPALSLVVTGANLHDVTQLHKVLDSIVIERTKILC